MPGHFDSEIAPPHHPSNAEAPELKTVLTELASVWHHYRWRAWRTGVVRAIVSGQFTRADYINWIACWIQQVRAGSRWMRTGADSLDDQHAYLGALVLKHAGEEQLDYDTLFEDYRAAGGTAESIDALTRNPAGEALNAYMHSLARQPNPVGLLGAIYIIEGTGQRIVPALLPLLRQHADIPEQALRFLTCHGGSDVSHIARWLSAVEITLALNPDCDREILTVARATADLCLLQMEHVL